MYSSRGAGAYGQQQPYASQSAYTPNLGPAYSGSSAGGPEGGPQLSVASRHAAMLGGPQEPDISGYRGHPSAGGHYGGQYSSVYGSAALSSGQQVPGMSARTGGPSALEGRSGYGSVMTDSPKFASSDYITSSNHGYGHKSDQLFGDKLSDYQSLDRRQYGERQSAFVGRDLQNEASVRHGDSIGFGHQHQADIYDRLDQASLLRQEQLLKAQSLQSASLEGGSRQADYLAARGGIRHPAQDLMSYGGRMDADPRSLSGRVDADPRNLSTLGGSSFGGQHAPSILGAAPHRNVDDLMYAQSSGYGVSLPPGRDYATGKGLHGTPLDSDYPGTLLSRSAHSRIDERKDDRGGYARELERREEERRREHLRERERDREREKERERERERERDRERERKREKERERERILERREKERERERERVLEVRRERGPEIRRERSPLRISRDRAERRDSSLTKDGRSIRRDSPRHEALHRRPSPVKEKRREYVCKVYSTSLVEMERDYLSLDKRYPRLFVSPDCSKVVVNWPRESLKLPLRTPVSFEHDFIEEDSSAEHKEPSTFLPTDQVVKSESITTVWNAKVILMSGLSQNALEELSSEKSYDDRIPHFCNMLRFAILKKDHSIMAIGGPWDTVDGGDPSVDDFSLVQTALRHAKDVSQLDLKNCRHWNRFLEIHYDRIGKDGLFSHKEVTVLYVPDLSDCLPPLDAWRDQWFAHKKAVADREHRLALKKEKPKEKKEGSKDKEIGSSKEVKREEKSEKNLDSSSGQAVDVSIKQKDGHGQKANAADGDENIRVEKKDVVQTVEDVNNAEKKEMGESASVQTTGSGNLGKKKIVKKIVKQKGADKKDSVENSTKQSDTLDAKGVGETISSQKDEASADAPSVKTFIRKKVVKKVPVVKTVQKEKESMQSDMKTEKESECLEDTPKDKQDSTSDTVVQDTVVKKTAKKKIIRRVPKRKVTGEEANDGVSDGKKDDDKDGKTTVQAGTEAKKLGQQCVDVDDEVGGSRSESAKTISESVKQFDAGNASKTGSKSDGEKKDEKRIDESTSASKVDAEADKQKASQKDSHGKRDKLKERGKLKDEEKKVTEGKDESRSKSSKDIKDKKQPEEPSRPGLLLQTKGPKGSKLRSLSLSLDSLLDYTDKDIEESTFELSLFAESLYEMLQYQMGSRILSFLQKLRIKFLMKRNQRKRQREEIPKKSEDNSSTKRVKAGEDTMEVMSAKNETQDAGHQDDQKTIIKEEDKDTQDAVHKHGQKITVQDEGNENPDAVRQDDQNTIVKEDTSSGAENARPEDEIDDEDPEEDPEEDEEMLEGSPQNDLLNEENAEGESTDAGFKSEKAVENMKDEEQKDAKESAGFKSANVFDNLQDEEQEVAEKKEIKPMTNSEKKEGIEKKRTKETTMDVDKELLQAFRFFDRNRVGYIRVEDMRLIIHNLGKFLSHRDVKELVQSALLESNTGRDDRILYNKLVKMTDI
ncbi:hypothetical protein NMG60_11021653 [Bertholletia excelsa]